jgi:hypothetical protein
MIKKYPKWLSKRLLPFHFDTDPDTDLTFQFDPDPDPTFQSDTDPDPASQNDADPDHQHCFAGSSENYEFLEFLVFHYYAVGPLIVGFAALALAHTEACLYCSGLAVRKETP